MRPISRCCLATLALASVWAGSATAAPSVARELALAPADSGAAMNYTQGLSLAAVLKREADARDLAAAARPDAGYQKQTEFDNTPYRFNMKPGEKMNAAQFDAWMASRGIRIVPAKPAAAAQTASQ